MIITKGARSTAPHGEPSTARPATPARGFVLKASGLLACTATAAPDKAAIPVKREGSFFCATSITSSTISARYTVHDTTDPNRVSTVAPA
ncbi:MULTISPECIES: hypothetical protein [unclassified Streptomyces]|uniref:hypothetical protein n=1 Tax=unclassified Streptomyces TaxID=2593676 RepID=UPI00068CE3A4|nr:hypothetical protein [Streptomyces sp. NRRL F-2747]